MHVYPILVQLEDCDAGGIVYHANYLNYMERARSQILRDAGKSFGEWLKAGVGIVVAEAKMKFIRPARLDDRLWVLTTVQLSGRADMWLKQVVVNQDPATTDPATATIHAAEIRLVCVDMTSVKPREWTAELRKALGLPGA